MGEGMTKRPRAILLALVMLLSTVAVPSVADQPGNLSNDPFSDFDSDISGLLSNWQIPGAQVAVMYNGSLVFNKGYGITANGTDENGTYWSSPVTVDSKFRIASLSKAVTAAGILTLVEDGSISLDDKMVDLVPDLIPTEFEGCDYPNHSTSYSINDIVQGLIQILILHIGIGKLGLVLGRMMNA